MRQKNREYQANLNMALEIRLKKLQQNAEKLEIELAEQFSEETNRTLQITYNSIECTLNRLTGDFTDKRCDEINLRELKQA